MYRDRGSHRALGLRSGENGDASTSSTVPRWHLAMPAAAVCDSPRWAIDTTRLTWADCDLVEVISHATGLDFPHCCMYNESRIVSGHGGG